MKQGMRRRKPCRLPLAELNSHPRWQIIRKVAWSLAIECKVVKSAPCVQVVPPPATLDAQGPLADMPILLFDLNGELRHCSISLTRFPNSSPAGFFLLRNMCVVMLLGSTDLWGIPLRCFFLSVAFSSLSHEHWQTMSGRRSWLSSLPAQQSTLAQMLIQSVIS